jgi:hypothetical protein
LAGKYEKGKQNNPPDKEKILTLRKRANIDSRGKKYYTK